ncbi:MAG TPA: SMC-Scp complex subunit ScpB, partial [Blastocatellia bacterium]|nr:SMC-Scp complex subunit ScpB [Blastocatellia bacterium]
MTIDELKPIIESLIFVSEEPITTKQLTSILEEATAEDIETAVEQLADECNSRAGGIEIRRIAGGYRMTTRPDKSEYV